MPPTICVTMPNSERYSHRQFCRRAVQSIVPLSIVSLFLFTVLTLGSATAAPAISTADPNRYLNDIKALTTPAMEGRGAGSKGLNRAEHLIANRYKSLGLEPAGTNSYLQPFTLITGAQLKAPLAR